MKNEIDIAKYVTPEGVFVWTEGSQYRCNHVKCPAGPDIKERLYIKAVRPINSWIAHCHNCGNSGVLFARGLRTLTEVLETKPDTYSEYGTPLGFTRPSKPIEDLRIKAWLFKHDIYEEDWNKLNFTEDVPGGILLMPINRDGEGQLRNFNGGLTKSKYVSYFKDHKATCYLPPSFSKNIDVVLTEDILSAYRVNRDLGLNGIALLGTKLSARTLINLSWFSGRIYIWLDGDSTGKKASVQVYGELVLAVRNPVYIVLAGKSPKEYNRTEIQDAFNEGTKHLI